MPVVNPGEVWMMDLGMTAKVPLALLLTDTRADSGPAQTAIKLLMRELFTKTACQPTPGPRLGRRFLS